MLETLRTNPLPLAVGALRHQKQTAPSAADSCSLSSWSGKTKRHLINGFMKHIENSRLPKKQTQLIKTLVNDFCNIPQANVRAKQDIFFKIRELNSALSSMYVTLELDQESTGYARLNFMAFGEVFSCDVIADESMKYNLKRDLEHHIGKYGDTYRDSIVDSKVHYDTCSLPDKSPFTVKNLENALSNCISEKNVSELIKLGDRFYHPEISLPPGVTATRAPVLERMSVFRQIIAKLDNPSFCLSIISDSQNKSPHETLRFELNNTIIFEESMPDPKLQEKDYRDIKKYIKLIMDPHSAGPQLKIGIDYLNNNKINYRSVAETNSTPQNVPGHRYHDDNEKSGMVAQPAAGSLRKPQTRKPRISEGNSGENVVLRNSPKGKNKIYDNRTGTLFVTTPTGIRDLEKEAKLEQFLRFLEARNPDMYNELSAGISTQKMADVGTVRTVNGQAVHAVASVDIYKENIKTYQLGEVYKKLTAEQAREVIKQINDNLSSFITNYLIHNDAHMENILIRFVGDKLLLQFIDYGRSAADWDKAYGMYRDTAARRPDSVEDAGDRKSRYTDDASGASEDKTSFNPLADVRYMYFKEGQNFVETAARAVSKMEKHDPLYKLVSMFRKGNVNVKEQIRKIGAEIVEALTAIESETREQLTRADITDVSAIRDKRSKCIKDVFYNATNKLCSLMGDTVRKDDKTEPDTGTGRSAGNRSMDMKRLLSSTKLHF